MWFSRPFVCQIRRSRETMVIKSIPKWMTDFTLFWVASFGKLAMRMLLDHKAEVGYRLVDRVILVGQKDPDPGKARSFLIQLSEPRSRKRAASDYPSLPSIKRRRLSNSIEYIFESRDEWSIRAMPCHSFVSPFRGGEGAGPFSCHRWEINQNKSWEILRRY